MKALHFAQMLGLAVAAAPLACTLGGDGLGAKESATSATSSGSATGAGGASSTSGAGGASSTSGAGGAPGTGGAGGAAASGGAGGGVGGEELVDPCGAGSTADFQDNFDDNKTGPQWATYGGGQSGTTVAEMNQEVTLGTDGTQGHWAGYSWASGVRSLHGCSIFIEVKSISAPSSAMLVYLAFKDGKPKESALNIIEMKGQIIFNHTYDHAPVTEKLLPYDPSVHRWWRIRESKGMIHYYTSPNGRAWTEQFSLPMTPGFVGASFVDFGIGATEDVSGGGTAVFDNLNAAPPP